MSRPPQTGLTDKLFVAGMATLGGLYVVLVLFLLAADVSFTRLADLNAAWASPEVRFATVLSLATATISAILSVWIAVPIGYFMTHGWSAGTSPRKGKACRLVYALVDGLLDVPIVLPPLVVGVSLLILFRFAPFAWISDYVVYEIPAVILAQFVVACAFAVRTVRATFEQISDRQERVAMTLGASRAVAFWTVLLPQARPGLIAAATISWARSLGEFGPVLLFASSTRMRTEVLPTTIYLEMQAGNLRGALAVSLLMVGLAMLALLIARLLGQGRLLA